MHGIYTSVVLQHSYSFIIHLLNTHSAQHTGTNIQWTYKTAVDAAVVKQLKRV